MVARVLQEEENYEQIPAAATAKSLQFCPTL